MPGKSKSEYHRKKGQIRVPVSLTNAQHQLWQDVANELQISLTALIRKAVNAELEFDSLQDDDGFIPPYGD